MAGFYALERLSDSKVELEALFIDPDHLRKGIGRKLFEHAMQHARSEGFIKMTIQGDPNAEQFYLTSGAVRVGDIASGSIAGRTLPLFEVKL